MTLTITTKVTPQQLLYKLQDLGFIEYSLEGCKHIIEYYEEFDECQELDILQISSIFRENSVREIISLYDLKVKYNKNTRRFDEWDFQMIFKLLTTWYVQLDSGRYVYMDFAK